MRSGWGDSLCDLSRTDVTSGLVDFYGEVVGCECLDLVGVPDRLAWLFAWLGRTPDHWILLADHVCCISSWRYVDGVGIATIANMVCKQSIVAGGTIVVVTR